MTKSSITSNFLVRYVVVTYPVERQVTIILWISDYNGGFAQVYIPVYSV